MGEGGGNMVHTAYDYSDTSDLLGDPKNLRVPQYYNIVHQVPIMSPKSGFIL
jgi:hypothetical protein